VAKQEPTIVAQLSAMSVCRALDNLWPPSEEDTGGYMSVGGRVAMERLAWIEQGLSKKSAWHL